MKNRSIIVLLLWTASLATPFLPLRAESCAATCCPTQVAVCDTEAMDNDCPRIQDATRLHPIPVVPINVIHGKTIQATIAASLMMPLELSPAHPTIHAQSLPLRLPPPPTHLLI
ncbi:MAG: hypothetical protein IIB42_03455 [Candidatus Marinimicrobia bacterium]|nr:hypothetical protein [Candidatus Neomarinimicrobiota bacterium]